MAYKLKVAPVNSNNFLRWYPNVTPTIANSDLSNGLHNSYTYKWRTQPDLIPVLVGDTLTMYTNFDSTTYLTGKFVKVVEESSCGVYTVINDVAKYDITATAWGTNNAKIVLTIPVTNTDNNKKIRLAIVDGVDAVEYVSNYFLVGQLTSKNINNTHLISFYSKSNIYNYEWAGFDELVDAFYQIRVSSSIVGISYPSEKEIYTEATTGKPRVTRAVNNKTYNFEIYYSVEELHDAVSTVSNFRYFGINGKQYIVEEYEVEFVRNLNIFKGIMTIKDVEYDRRINTCVT